MFRRLSCVKVPRHSEQANPHRLFSLKSVFALLVAITAFCFATQAVATPPPVRSVKAALEDFSRLGVSIVATEQTGITPSLTLVVICPRETNRMKLVQIHLLVARKGEDRTPYDIPDKPAREVKSRDGRIEATLFGKERERAVLIVFFEELDEIAYREYRLPVSAVPLEKGPNK